MAADSIPPSDDGALQAALGRLVASGALDLHQARAILQEYSAHQANGSFPVHQAPVPLQSGLPLSGMSAQNLQDQMYLRQAGYTFRYEPETGSVYSAEDSKTYSEEIGYDSSPPSPPRGSQLVRYTGGGRTPGKNALATTGALGGTGALDVAPASWEASSPPTAATNRLRRSAIRAQAVEDQGFFADEPDYLHDNEPYEDVAYEPEPYETPSRRRATRTGRATSYREMDDYDEVDEYDEEDYEEDYEEPVWTSHSLETGGYLVGAALLGVAVWAVRPQWEQLGHSQQLMVLAGPSVILFLTALLILKTTPGGWPTHDDDYSGPYRRIASVLLVGASTLFSGAGWVYAAPDARPTTAAAAGTALSLLGYLMCRTGLSNLTTGLGCASMIGYALNDLAGAAPHILGSAIAGFAVLWAVMALSGILDELAVGLAASGIMAVAGGEIVIRGAENPDAGYGIVAAAALMGLGSYMPTRHPLVLFVGMGSLALVVSQATLHFGADVIGSEGQPLVSGISVATASLLGLMTWRATHRDDLGFDEEEF